MTDGAVTSAVIVLFQPDPERLAKLVEVLHADGLVVILADNSEPAVAPALTFPGRCRIVAMDGNRGIAAAQNAGVAAARAAGAGVIILFDQDSTIEPGFAARLTHGMRGNRAEIRSPYIVDDQSGEPLHVERLDGQGRGMSQPAVPGDYADIVIASGMAMSLAAYDRVGPFDEGLFIDLVDSEWCLRARAVRLPILVSPYATMRHRVGDRIRRMGPLALAIHSPTRVYYQVRNALLLVGMAHVPKRYAIRSAAAIVGNRTILALTSRPLLSYCRNLARGIFDATLGRQGRKPEATFPYQRRDSTRRP